MTAIGDWLKKLGACSEAMPEFENAAGIAAGYASIKRPDWLLWFCFSQSTDEAEKVRVLSALHKLMSGPIVTALEARPAVLSAAVRALRDTSKFMEGHPAPREEATAHHDALLGHKTLDSREKYAVDLARCLLDLCLTQAGASSGNVGAMLANKWARFLGASGDAALLKVTQGLRDAIGFANKSSLPT